MFKIKKYDRAIQPELKNLLLISIEINTYYTLGV